MAYDRRESNKKYYEKNKRKWGGKYDRRKRLKAKKKARGPYMRLSEKQSKFKASVEHGTDPVEAIKKAYPGITNISRKLYDLKKHPALANTLDKFMAELEEVGLTTRYGAGKYKEITDKTEEKSNPHTDKVTSGILMHLDKLRGFEVQRSESRNYNININVGPEQAKFMENVPEEEEEEKEDVIDV